MRTKLIGAALAAAAATTAMSGVATAGGAPPPEPTLTLAEILLSDGDDFDDNPWDYDIVTQAVLLFPGLVAAASNPDAELTVFLPNDNAFAWLVKDLTGSFPASEEDGFAAVASLGLPTVEAVLTYHIVAGPPISFATAQQADGAVLTTLQGGTIEVDVKGRRNQNVQLIDADTNDTNPKVVDGDVGGEALNGYAHGISRVLRPVDLP